VFNEIAAIEQSAKCEELSSREWLYFKSTNRTLIGSVPGAVATWPNHQSPKYFMSIDADHGPGRYRSR